MLILVIEDERRIREGIAQMLADEGYDVIEAEDAREGQRRIEEEGPSVVLSDIHLPDGDGFMIMRRCREQGLETAFIFMTAFGSRDVAVRAIREGAHDYVSKPLRFDELFARLHRLEELQRLQGQVRRGSARKRDQGRLAVLGESSSMRRVRSLAGKAANSMAPLLITGETGVGKGLLAHLVHAIGPRGEQPFVSINCASIPDTLLESELFGYRQGAFTGAERNRKGLLEEVGTGSLFLDEIGELPSHLQAKLLHVLDDGLFRPLGSNRDLHFRGRVIAATNVDLEALVEARDFRRDLYYRLSVLTIEIPPLRERPEDLLPLAETIYRELATEMGISARELPFAVAEVVKRRPWPGNVRELRNYLERVLIFGDETEEDGLHLSLTEAVRRFERSWIHRVLQDCKGDKALAAKRMGMGLSTLYRKLENDEED